MVYCLAEFAYDLAKDNPWIVAVVGWVDLTDPKVGSLLPQLRRGGSYIVFGKGFLWYVLVHHSVDPYTITGGVNFYLNILCIVS